MTMTPDRVYIFDTTLRDGEQSPGCTMSPAEKLRLARQLERLGVDVLEAGFPVASPAEWEAVHAIAQEVRDCGVAALCRARTPDIEAAARALEGAARPRIHVFLATSAIHLEHKLQITPDEALRQLEDGVRLARTACPEVEFSPEDASSPTHWQRQWLDLCASRWTIGSASLPARSRKLTRRRQRTRGWVNGPAA